MAGCARDFQRPRTAAAPSDRGINTVRAFKTERQVTSLRGRNHVATTFFNWTPRGFFVAGEHHDDAGVFQRSDISQCLQGVEQNDVATLHVRATIAVCPIAVSAEVLPLKHSVDMAKEENSFTATAICFGHEVSSAIHFGRHVDPSGSQPDGCELTSENV